MRKVTTINLNHNAYQIDEDGYELLRAYLENAEHALANNPDRTEILADLEQAIAEKCLLAMGSYKSVISAAEIERILKEMGPVEGSAANASAEDATTPGVNTNSSGNTSSQRSPRRLFRIREGQKWSGVCNGLAAYAGVDVTWVRVLFALLTVSTGGFWLVAYIALVFIVPIASTPEEIAAAHGQPINAQELVDRVKKKHDDFRQGRWQHRRLRHPAQWWAAAPPPANPPGYAARVTGGVMLPVLTMLSAAWFAAMVIAFMAVWWSFGHHLTYGWEHSWPNGHFFGHSAIPEWMPLIALVGVYALIALPLSAARRTSLYYANGGRRHGWADAWSGLLWFVLVILVLGAAWQFTPWLHELLLQLFNGSTTLRRI
jgi:phage shock protein PspC (stress-responsive transcriptional regulator)